MGTYRLYTRDDGQSHIEAIDLTQRPDWTVPQAATMIVFRTAPVGMFLDWHPASRREYVVILSGQLEIGLGDGSKHVFGAGDARLVEDTTGHGHTTAVYGDEPCVIATIPLAEQ